MQTARAAHQRRSLTCCLLLMLGAGGCAHSGGGTGTAQTAEERISTGYGTEPRSTSTASAASVARKQLRDIRADRFEEMLRQLPGVDVTRRGSDYSVRIRGIRSFYGSNEPLYVVDGQVVHSTDLITPQSVVRIDVLKDPASLAMYGSRGANGIIVVTTIHSR
jgi:TonB-dependent starch-binding outer membrane protein SusC